MVLIYGALMIKVCFVNLRDVVPFIKKKVKDIRFPWRFRLNFWVLRRPDLWYIRDSNGVELCTFMLLLTRSARILPTCMLCWVFQ